MHLIKFWQLFGTFGQEFKLIRACAWDTGGCQSIFKHTSACIHCVYCVSDRKIYNINYELVVKIGQIWNTLGYTIGLEITQLSTVTVVGAAVEIPRSISKHLFVLNNARVYNRNISISMFT